MLGLPSLRDLCDRWPTFRKILRTPAGQAGVAALIAVFFLFVVASVLAEGWASGADMLEFLHNVWDVLNTPWFAAAAIIGAMVALYIGSQQVIDADERRAALREESEREFAARLEPIAQAVSAAKNYQEALLRLQIIDGELNFLNNRFNRNEIRNEIDRCIGAFSNSDEDEISGEFLRLPERLQAWHEFLRGAFRVLGKDDAQLGQHPQSSPILSMVGTETVSKRDRAHHITNWSQDRRTILDALTVVDQERHRLVAERNRIREALESPKPTGAGRFAELDQ